MIFAGDIPALAVVSFFVVFAEASLFLGRMKLHA
jgi:hypothetical protein